MTEKKLPCSARRKVSLRSKEFYDHRQAHNYLANCIVMYDGKPVYVNEVYPYDNENKFLATFYYVGNAASGNRCEAKLEDKRWDLNPVSLGFVSTLDGPYIQCPYASRIPQRAWKIGLTHDNLNLTPLKPTLRVNKQDMFLSNNMKNTILGNYMSYKDSIKKQKQTPIPFSRRFAVFKDNLYYKTINTPVGNVGDREPELSEKFVFLKEVLKEDLK